MGGKAGKKENMQQSNKMLQGRLDVSPFGEGHWERVRAYITETHGGSPIEHTVHLSFG